MERFLRLTPQKANNFGRAGSYGSWFNFYLCAVGGTISFGASSPRCRRSDAGSLIQLPSADVDGEPMPRMKPFRKRNPLPIGAASLAILLLLTAASLNIRDLPLIGQGPTYSARFSESAGVQPDDDVRIAGIRIGTVTDLELDGKDVVISFKAPDAWVGDRTSASIEIKTVLGQKYINLEPAGEAPLDPDASIPRERTRAPFDVIQAFSQLSTTVEDLDTDQLAQSLGVLSETLDGAAGPVRGALDGLSRLSRTISSRDQELARLLANTRTTTQVLADRDAEVERLINDGNLLLGELRARKAAIDNLLNGTIALSAAAARAGGRQRGDAAADPRAARRRALHAGGELGEPGERPAAAGAVRPGLRATSSATGAGSTPTSATSTRRATRTATRVTSLDPGGLTRSCFNPALLTQILQNALAQLGLAGVSRTPTRSRRARGASSRPS